MEEPNSALPSYDYYLFSSPDSLNKSIYFVDDQGRKYIITKKDNDDFNVTSTMEEPRDNYSRARIITHSFSSSTDSNNKTKEIKKFFKENDQARIHFGLSPIFQAQYDELNEKKNQLSIKFNALFMNGFNYPNLQSSEKDPLQNKGRKIEALLAKLSNPITPYKKKKKLVKNIEKEIIQLEKSLSEWERKFQEPYTFLISPDRKTIYLTHEAGKTFSVSVEVAGNDKRLVIKEIPTPTENELASYLELNISSNLNLRTPISNWNNNPTKELKSKIEEYFEPGNNQDFKPKENKYEELGYHQYKFYLSNDQKTVYLKNVTTGDIYSGGVSANRQYTSISRAHTIPDRATYLHTEYYPLAFRDDDANIQTKFTIFNETYLEIKPSHLDNQTYILQPRDDNPIPGSTLQPIKHQWVFPGGILLEAKPSTSNATQPKAKTIVPRAGAPEVHYYNRLDQDQLNLLNPIPYDSDPYKLGNYDTKEPLKGKFHLYSNKNGTFVAFESITPPIPPVWIGTASSSTQSGTTKLEINYSSANLPLESFNTLKTKDPTLAFTVPDNLLKEKTSGIIFRSNHKTSRLGMQELYFPYSFAYKQFAMKTLFEKKFEPQKILAPHHANAFALNNNLDAATLSPPFSLEHEEVFTRLANRKKAYSAGRKLIDNSDSANEQNTITLIEKLYPDAASPANKKNKEPQPVEFRSDYDADKKTHTCNIETSDTSLREQQIKIFVDQCLHIYGDHPMGTTLPGFSLEEKKLFKKFYYERLGWEENTDPNHPGEYTKSENGVIKNSEGKDAPLQIFDNAVHYKQYKDLTDKIQDGTTSQADKNDAETKLNTLIQNRDNSLKPSSSGLVISPRP